MKTIWIMRHGEASWKADSDQQRELTAGGRQQIASVTEKLALSGAFHVWVSPYLRAQQSSDEFLKNSMVELVEKREESMITPDSDPAMLVELIEASDFSRLLLVSHMPLVARLTQLLTRDDRIGGFQTAQVVQCSQSASGQPWRLESIYSPSLS